MNKNPAIQKNNEAQLVRKHTREYVSKTNLPNYQPFMIFFHNVKSGSVEVLNNQSIGGVQ